MSPRAKVSLVDVARVAGVSIATVSRALNDSTLATPATRERVLQAAAKLGYVPNPRFRLMGMTRAGNAGATGNIGVLVDTPQESEFVGDPYFARLFWSIERELRDRGRHLVLSTMAGQGERYLPSFVRDCKVDGVLVAGSPSPAYAQRIETAVPVVTVNGATEGLTVSAVLPDEESGIRQALEYLRELGHRKIFFFCINDRVDPKPMHSHAVRTRAFERYASQWNMEEARAVLLPGRSKTLEETARDQLRGWRKAGDMPTALLCAADCYALAFLQAAQSLGIRVPEQLSIIGADDTIFCEHSRPKLTSIRQPLEAMGAAAVRILLDQIAGTENVKSVQRFEVELIHRESCQHS